MSEEQINNIKENISRMNEKQAKEMLFDTIMQAVKITEIVKENTLELRQARLNLRQTRQLLKASTEKQSKYIN